MKDALKNTLCPLRHNRGDGYISPEECNEHVALGWCDMQCRAGRFINCTPHDIAVGSADFQLEFPKSGDVARVETNLEEVDHHLFRQTKGPVQGLPAPVEGVKYIVSSIVFDATDRHDVVAPATSHPDVIRNEKGHIVAVPGFNLK